MARQNYQFGKRQRELAKKQKREEKLQKKREKGKGAGSEEPEPLAAEPGTEPVAETGNDAESPAEQD